MLIATGWVDMLVVLLVVMFKEPLMYFMLFAGLVLKYVSIVNGDERHESKRVSIERAIEHILLI